MKSKAKSAPNVLSYNKDVICLPNVYVSPGKQGISIPRGKQHAQLGYLGVVGKLHLASDTSETNMLHEVRSAFDGPMRSNLDFPSTSCGWWFKHLDHTFSLIIVSDAKQVASLGGQSGTVYILAEKDLEVILVSMIHRAIIPGA